jgi:hypothetical protein
MRNLAIVGLISVVIVTGCSSTNSSSGENSPPWMIALNADISTEKIGESTYLLLDDPQGTRLFSERPDRVSFPVSPETVVALWQQFGFIEVPPNAAIFSQGNEPTIVALTDPAWTDNESIRIRVVEPSNISITGPSSIVIDASNPVSSQVTDAITQSNVKVLGEASAITMGQLYETMASSVAMAAANATEQQQESNTQYQAAAAAAAQQILEVTMGQGNPAAATPTN